MQGAGGREREGGREGIVGGRKVERERERAIKVGR